MSDDYDTSNWTPEMHEEWRIEEATSPLFDLFLRFEKAFGRLAIDRLDISDEDAEKAAAAIENSEGLGPAFAYFLRQIKHERIMRRLGHKVMAVWAVNGTPEHGMSFEEVEREYAKLGEGQA